MLLFGEAMVAYARTRVAPPQPPMAKPVVLPVLPSVYQCPDEPPFDERWAAFCEAARRKRNER